MHVFKWTLGSVCVLVLMLTSYVGCTGQLEQVTDYPVRSNQICVWEEGGRGRRGRRCILRYIFISSLV